MSRHQSIRMRLVVLGVGVWLAAAGAARPQGIGPYQNPYGMAPYGGYAPGHPAAYGGGMPGIAPPGQTGWPDDGAGGIPARPIAGRLSTSSAGLADDGYAAAPVLGGGLGPGSFFYTGGTSNVAAPNAHIDLAPIFTHFRLRVDAAWNNPTPDRAEYFQGKSGAFRNAPAPFADPDAPGPRLVDTNVDYQDIRGYLEVAMSPILSGFVEMPYRFIDPDQNQDTSGFADMNAGVKAALLTSGEDYITFQVTTYIPTGDADRGLGTSHLTIEPAVLFHERYTDRLSFYGEGRYWIPVDGTDFAGQIVRYGVGTGYDLGYGSRGNERVTALAELTGWTITHGGVFDGNSPAAGIQNAADDTIINAVLGMRYTLGNGSFAASWSRALTHQVWYEDMMRLEYRSAF